MLALGPNAQLALDTIHGRRTKGIPSWQLNVLEHQHLERYAGAQPGEYVKQPIQVYLAFQKAVGTCMVDQWIPDNGLTMGSAGYEEVEQGATTGAERIELDGILIDSPEAVVEHMERFIIPRLAEAAADFDEDDYVQQTMTAESDTQAVLGPDILKAPYAVAAVPSLYYGLYGYVNYFMAFALYPEVMEKHFSIQADYFAKRNRGTAKAYEVGKLPPMVRLDHDMADSRGTLANINQLDRIWFPHLVRALEPMLKTNVKMIWHCDGNLMEMVPRLLDVGLAGFQGFQYEDGMDYERICKMKTRDGDDLLILAGVSVTRTLPFGKPDDVKREVQWLVDNGPKTGLFLSASSSITPGVPWENLKTLVDGLKYYREHANTG